MSHNAPHAKPAAWVGEGAQRRDVTVLSDRALLTATLDAGLRAYAAAQRQADEFRVFRQSYEDEIKVLLLKELPDHARRLHALELGPMREEQSSSHEWNDLLGNAGVVLSQRVKDPKDRLSSERAREIAKEVIESVKTVNDARSFRSLKLRGWTLVFEALKFVVAAGLGAAAAHYGLHIG